MNRAFGTSGAGITDNRNRQMELVLKERVEGAPVVRMVNAIIEEAYNRNASDIHVEPGNQDVYKRQEWKGTRSHDLSGHFVGRYHRVIGFHADNGPAPVCIHDERTGTSPADTCTYERKPWLEKSRDAVSVAAIGFICPVHGSSYDSSCPVKG